MANQLIISNTIIPFDSDNRVNLNALHRASGLGKSKQPNNWLRLDSTKELELELSKSSDLRISPISRCRGVKGGTFVDELLAISYAGWISPKFQLEVNRAFLQSKQKPQLPANIIPANTELSLNDLICELAKVRQVSTQEICHYYTAQFSSEAWFTHRGFEQAMAKSMMRNDLANELKLNTPELMHLKQQAKALGYRLIEEDVFNAFLGRMQMQQSQIDNLVDGVMKLSRNNSVLSNNQW